MGIPTENMGVRGELASTLAQADDDTIRFYAQQAGTLRELALAECELRGLKAPFGRTARECDTMLYYVTEQDAVDYIRGWLEGEAEVNESVTVPSEDEIRKQVNDYWRGIERAVSEGMSFAREDILHAAVDHLPCMDQG